MKNERLEAALTWAKKNNLESTRLNKFNRETKRNRIKKKLKRNSLKSL